MYYSFTRRVTGFQADTSESGAPSCRSVKISTDKNISFISREIFVSAYKVGYQNLRLNGIIYIVVMINIALSFNLKSRILT